MDSHTPFREEQRKDSQVNEVIHFLETQELPSDDRRARKIASQQSLFAILDGILYYIDHRRNHQRRVVVPKLLRERVLEEAHRGQMSGHFSGKHTFSSLARHWWWENMYVETMRYVQNCPECTTSMGAGR